jgi:hypothetical protein
MTDTGRDTTISTRQHDNFTKIKKRSRVVACLNIIILRKIYRVFVLAPLKVEGKDN